jgi:tight adherence protein B
MSLPSLPLLMCGAVLLLLCGGATLLLMRMDAAAETAVRTLAVLGAYRSAGIERRHHTRSLLDRLPLTDIRIWTARLFGIEIGRRAEYPVHWWVVLIGALGAARAATWLIALLVADLPQWAPVPVLWVMFSRVVFHFFARRRRDLLFRQFPDALGMIVRALRVGQTVTQALRSVARDAQTPTAIAFVRLADRIAIGVPLSEALPEMAADSGLTEYRFFATTLLLQNQTGGGLTEALETLAEVIRGRVALRRRAYAMAGEARASAILLAVMPVVTFIAMMLASPAYTRLLVDDPVGRHVLGVAVGMVLFGGVIMIAMIRSALR